MSWKCLTVKHLQAEGVGLVCKNCSNVINLSWLQVLSNLKGELSSPCKKCGSSDWAFLLTVKEVEHEEQVEEALEKAEQLELFKEKEEGSSDSTEQNEKRSVFRSRNRSGQS